MSKVRDDNAGTDSGTSEIMPINDSPESCGMGTVGKDQKPQPMPKKSAKKYGKSFSFR